MSPEKSSPRAVLVGVVLLYLFLSLVTFNDIEEDAFIYFRLAENIAQGFGYVFNQGGERVEAGSSVLWLLLLALLVELPIHIIISAKLAGYAFGSIGLWLVYRLSRHHVSNRALAYLPALLTAVSTPFIANSQRGLETPLYVCLVLWLVLCCTNERLGRLWVVPAVLLLPARPEGFLVLLGLVPFFYLHRKRGRELWSSAGIVVLAGLLGLAARFLYFHDFVPHSFYFKLGSNWERGWEKVHGYLLWNLVYLFGLPLYFVVWRRSFWSRQRIILAGFIAVIATWSTLTYDHMPYHRHLVPAMPLIYVLITGGIDRLIRDSPRAWRIACVAYCALFVTSTLLIAKSADYFDRGYWNPVRSALGKLLADPRGYATATASKIGAPLSSGSLDGSYGGRTIPIAANYQSRVGDFLRENYPKGTAVIYDQMGQTPFHAGADKRFIDSMGLTDRTVGYLGFHRRGKGFLASAYEALVTRVRGHFLFGRKRLLARKTALEHLFRAQADVILINRTVVEYLPLSFPAWMLGDPRLEERYEPKYLLGEQVVLYERRGTPPKELWIPDGLEVEEIPIE